MSLYLLHLAPCLMEYRLLAPALFNEIVPGILQEILSLPGLQKTGNFNRLVPSLTWSVNRDLSV